MTFEKAHKINESQSESPAYYLLLLIFFASGFAGLIYESVWAQYLKLFLGHAAYAQTMVLCIFMGGLALGAWFVARFIRRIAHPLLVYAGIEAVIGLLGLVFHGAFTRAIEFHYHFLLPLTTDPLAATAIKGMLAALLIGPQAMLLGATFPLMTAGMLRAFPRSSGSKISLLYFINSIGAAAGVLVSAFLLISWSGLPGTVLSAGLINVVVALSAWVIVRRAGARFAPKEADESAGTLTGAPGGLAPSLLLVVAAFTGFASFIYEVVWIRMLSLVLGGSTHSFELMLSAFITGLALGSLAIRRRIDRITQPGRVLGYIQIAMGLLALGSLWVYSESFHWMATLLHGLARTEPAYNLYLLASHALCFAIMLPATFMAGMTLPLITHSLLRSGYGERAVGAVYSVNTLGSIAGVAFVVHLAIPLAGLKGSLILGGGIDMLLGLMLLAFTVGGLAAWRPTLAAVAAVAGTTAASLGVTLDPHKLNSGVYRYQQASLDAGIEFLYSGDGKTASVSLRRQPDGLRVLATNGKPDASLRPLMNSASSDEVTMILAANLAMAFNSNARSAANIGLGSGLTTQTLLNNPRLEKVDTIEIEQKMVDAARILQDRVGAIFSDRRSNIIIDDAKSFFATHRARYDIIVAEPSNPWVSGVSSLFTQEFYRRMLDHLTTRGVFVQWLQIYEIDHEAIASVMLALGKAFPNYTVYTTNDVDLLVVAWKDSAEREPDSAVLSWPELRADWRRINVESIQDIEARRIGGKSILDPLFRSYPVPTNSDYYPYLDERAARARFRGLSAAGYTRLGVAGLPVIEMLEGRPNTRRETRLAEHSWVDRAAGARNAMAVYQLMSGKSLSTDLVPGTRGDLSVLENYCSGGRLFTDKDMLIALVDIAAAITPFLTQQESRQLLIPVIQGKCISRLGRIGEMIGKLIMHIIERDAPGMRSLGEMLLEQLPREADRRLTGFALDAAMLGTIVGGDPSQARVLWQKYGNRVQTGSSIPIESRLMLSTAEVRMRHR